MRRLFLDTETTGEHPAEKLPYAGTISIPAYRIEDAWPDRLPEQNPWPRVVQVAWIFCEGTDKVAEESMLVRPEGFEIPSEATEIHGITTKEARDDGNPLQRVLDELEDALDLVEMVVAHNVDYDVKTLAAEYYRQGWADRDSWDRTYPPVQQQGLVCTMKSGTELCGIPRESGSGYKWPTLQELHTELFAEPVEQSHDALVDARACKRCYVQMRQRGVALHS